MESLLWFPYKVYPADRVLGWSKFAYKKFEYLSKFRESGVYFVELMEIFDKAVGDPWWIDAVRSIRHAEASELPKKILMVM